VTPFASRSLAELLDELAAPTPTPGGGTASAIVGAMGVSLLMMVAGLARTRTNTDEEKASLASARQALAPLRDRLRQLADEDAAAFNAVMAASRLPKGSDEEKRSRTRAVQAALASATVVPLDTLRACAEAMTKAEGVARSGNPSAASDVGVALELVEAAAAGAAANVRVNLEGITDAAFVAATSSETTRLLNDVDSRKRAAGACLGS
jgi:formiminotetrahydrofolate cyclodeaminase